MTDELDARRYRAFRKAVSSGNVLLDKNWRIAFEMWFARFYVEEALDEAIDKALRTS